MSKKRKKQSKQTAKTGASNVKKQLGKQPQRQPRPLPRACTQVTPRIVDAADEMKPMYYECRDPYMNMLEFRPPIYKTISAKWRNLPPAIGSTSAPPTTITTKIDLTEDVPERSDEVIDLDATAANHSTVAPAENIIPLNSRETTTNLDDSVIFVSEGRASKKMMTRLRRKMQENAYQLKVRSAEQQKPNEKKGESETNKKKRIIIIDGSNVAYGHSNGKHFSVRGLDLALQHFHGQGYEAKAVVPQYRMKRDKTDDWERMERLQQAGHLILTPSKELQGHCMTSYDDRFIVEMASKCNGAVVSNDNYNDLLREENHEWLRVIYTRVIGFTWLGDLLFLPQDPYGKRGPQLNEILFI